MGSNSLAPVMETWTIVQTRRDNHLKGPSRAAGSRSDCTVSRSDSIEFLITQCFRLLVNKKILSYLVALGWIIESVCAYILHGILKFKNVAILKVSNFLFVASLLRFGPNPRLNQPSITYHF